MQHTVHAGQVSKLATFAQKRSQARRQGFDTAGEGQKFPLLDVLDTFRSFGASDPRDKVYAALGFAGDIPCEQPIEIDYARPCYQILRDVAVSCLRQSSYNLRFLGYAGLHGTAHMPATWVPDWA